MSVELFPFRYRDPLTAKWVRARYRATREEIAARYAQWEITGPAEAREGGGAMFSPRYKLVTHAELQRLAEPAPQLDPHLAVPPAIERGECTLALLFLRRYVTYCARKRRYGPMEGAARLHAAIRRVADKLGQAGADL